MRSTRAGKAVLIGVAKARRVTNRGVRAVRRTATRGVAKLKNSKLVVSLNRSIGKGAKSLNELRERILQRFRFKRMWFEKHGRYIELWGEFNAKVLLIKEDGTVEFQDKKNSLTNEQRKIVHQGDQIGTKFIEEDGMQKIVVSDSFEEYYKNLEYPANKELIDQIRTSNSPRNLVNTNRNPIPEWARGTEFEKFYKKRGDINTTYEGKINPDEEIHHLTTMQNLEESVVKKAVSEGNFKINDAAENGKKVRSYSSETKTKIVNEEEIVTASPQGIHANHPNYSEGQRELLERFSNTYDKATGEQSANFLRAMNKKISNAIDNLKPNEVIDDLFKAGNKKKSGIHNIDDFFDDIIVNL